MNPRINLKSIFKNRNVIIYSLVIILIATVSLTAYVGYNEYTYRKVGVCFTENNYDLAEYYIDSISPSYKDVEKIKSLIHTVKNFDKTNFNDYSRVLAMLDSYKGFSNVNVNYFYNSYYHYVISLNKNNGLPQQQNQTPITAPAYSSAENTSSITFPFENTTVSNSVTVANTTAAYNAQSPSATQNSDTITVYYVESGEVYHINSSCRYLANSSNVLSGPIPEGRRVCKVCGEG